MIRDGNADQLDLCAPEDFATPFGAGLDPDNRWVRWAQQIPWVELAASYHATLKPGGRPAKPARLVLLEELYVVRPAAMEKEKGFVMDYADSDGINLYLETTGTGTPIVFVHEFAGDYRNWEPQVRYLARRYRCVTFNARGYPPSDVPERVADYGERQAAGDIAAVMDHVGLENAHIVGLSMGGYAALNFAIMYPKRAKSLVVAGAGHGSDPELREEFLENSDRLAERLVALGMEEGIDHYANSPIRRRFKEKDSRGFDEFNRQFAEHSPLGSSLTVRGYQMQRHTIYELETALAKISVPVLIVTGDDDEPCLQPAFFLKRTIPDARLWVVPRTTHTVNLEEPDAFNRTVLDFLNTVDCGEG